MELTVLVDNNTYIDQYYYGEPALCFHIKDVGKQMLFDVGYSDIFIKNAEIMGIDLKGVDTVILSHGHNDHTRGLRFFEGSFDMPSMELVAHPDTFEVKICDEEEIGAPFSREEMEKKCRLTLSERPMKISENITYLGQIPEMPNCEKRKKIGVAIRGEQEYDDTVLEDTALVYQNKEGLFIITGCSHSGICNIIEYAKIVCGSQKILGVIGGFHLFEVDQELERVMQYFLENDIRDIYPCHCVSLKVKCEMSKKCKVHEVGVGMKLYIK